METVFFNLSEKIRKKFQKYMKTFLLEIGVKFKTSVVGESELHLVCASGAEKAPTFLIRKLSKCLK